MTRQSAPFGTMLRVLMRMQFARLRRSWRPYIVVSAVMPAGIVLLIHLTNPGMAANERLNIISGAMLLAESIATIVMLSQYVAWLKVSHALDHYRVMPISLEMLVVALTTVYGLFAWPGVLLIALEGTFLDHIPMHFSPLMIVLMLVTSLAMGSVGTIIGLLAPDEGLAGLMGNLVMMGVLFLGMVPVRALGPWTIGLWILPSTGPLAILKGLVFFGSFNTGSHWLGLLLYAMSALMVSSYLMKRPG
ncbi:MAG: ABC transporter permease [Firmicutes bacterium]|nr:ABC transporter permease [Bacillota bacterium]